MSPSSFKHLVTAALAAAALASCTANAPDDAVQTSGEIQAREPNQAPSADDERPTEVARDNAATTAVTEGAEEVEREASNPGYVGRASAGDGAPEADQMAPEPEAAAAPVPVTTRRVREARPASPRTNLGGNLGVGAIAGSGGGRAAVNVPTSQIHVTPPTGDPQAAENFEDYGENDWTQASVDNLETFSIDVDAASYAIARRDLNSARLPNPASVRVEEFVNAFDYGYEGPGDTDTPFAVHLEAAPSEFGEGLQLLRVGIQGFETDPADRAPANLVFLVDTSGSMRSADKLGLVKYALGALLQSLGPDDTLSIVSYGGRAQVILPTTRVEDRASILEAINSLQAGGGTNGAEGIRTAYEVAQQSLRPGGTNRVIWCSDGDLNVGMTGDDLLEFIEENGRQGVALTTLGFGRGNLNDRDLERFANRGDGNYYYIDDRNEALRVLGEEVMSTLEIIARDVKIQVEMNAEAVESYRLIGYENRAVADQDFRNDAVDAGEIGSGHSVTALLEIRLNNDARIAPDPERLATVRVRYELPNEEGEGREVEQPIFTNQIAPSFEAASPAFRQAAAIAEFAEILRHAENTASDFDSVLAAIEGLYTSDDLQLTEFAALVTQARSIRN